MYFSHTHPLHCLPRSDPTMSPSQLHVHFVLLLINLVRLVSVAHLHLCAWLSTGSKQHTSDHILQRHKPSGPLSCHQLPVAPLLGLEPQGCLPCSQWNLDWFGPVQISTAAMHWHMQQCSRTPSSEHLTALLLPPPIHTLFP